MNRHKDTEQAILRGLADAQLEAVFNAEWIRLKRGKSEVLQDFIDAVKSEGITAREYYNRIYGGNLQRYADVLLVQPRNKIHV